VAQPALPPGFRLTPDVTLSLRAGGALMFGGTPLRLLRLTPAGRRVALHLLTGAPVTSAAHGHMARRLTSAGMAHPVPPGCGDLTISAVVPVRDRPEALAHCLAALDLPTVVVDDGSGDPAAVRELCARHGARLLRHDRAGGPAAARNAALARVGSDVVAFVDSDVVVAPQGLHRLLGHFADPLVVAVAPRVAPGGPAATVLERFLAVRSPLDLGQRAALVRPGTAVSYVPSACLLIRLAALPGFDEALRFGEDVDVVWRLLAAEGIVRYDPSVQVAHAEPATWPAALLRRHRYGMSAGPLANRHGDQLTHFRLTLLPLVFVVSLVIAPPVVSFTVGGLAAALTWRRLRRVGLPRADASRLVRQAFIGAVFGLGRYIGVLVPVLPIAALLPARQRRRLAAVALAPLLAEYLDRRPRLDPLRWAAVAAADDIAYASGVWRGCLQARSLRPLVPQIAFRPRLHRDRPPAPGGSPAGQEPDQP